MAEEGLKTEDKVEDKEVNADKAEEVVSEEVAEETRVTTPKEDQLKDQVLNILVTRLLVMLTNLLFNHVFVTGHTGELHISVRNLPHALGKTSGCQNPTSNEPGTSLSTNPIRLMTNTS